MAGTGVEAQLQLTFAWLPRPRSAGFLLLGMLAWLAAAFTAAVVIAVVLGIGSVLIRPVPGFARAAPPSRVAVVLAAAVAFQGTLFLAALRQGRLAGDGDRRIGLGLWPVRHRGRIALLCVVMIVWIRTLVLLTEHIPALEQFVKSITPDALAVLNEGGPDIVALKVALVVGLAPVSEELFFRGWLWEAFRRRGLAIFTTACLTSLPWLLLHGLDAPGRILFLIPAAVVISFARHLGHSVFASLAVHVANNGAAMLLQVLTEGVGAR